MNVIQKITSKTYSLRTMARVVGITIVVGMVAGSYATAVGLPVIQTTYADWKEARTITYVAPERDSKATTTPEKIDVYYQEELKALAEKYEQALKDEARTNAITRVEADLEEEKEAIRERALLQ